MHLEANVVRSRPSGKTSMSRTWLWRHTIDGGKTIVGGDPRPRHCTLQTRSVPGVEPHCVPTTVELLIWSVVTDSPVALRICIAAAILKVAVL